jgi:hypothetical protein
VDFKSNILRVERSQVSVYCELVADAAHGMYVAGILGVGFDLLADMLDVHDRRTSLAKERSIPQVLHDLEAAEDLTGMCREEAEDLELRSGKVNTCLTGPYLPAQEVDDKPWKIQPLVPVLGVHAPPAQVGPDAAHKLCRVHRLGDVIVGAHLEPNDDVSLAVAL